MKTFKTGILLALLIVSVFSGCDNEMRNQSKYKPLRESDFFADGMTSRPLVEGTVARGALRSDELLYTGKTEGKHSAVFPFEIDEKVLKRGQQRYNIYCAVCHDPLGYGRGMVVQRGFKQPASFHTDRLRDAAPGYYFDVMTNGFGVMNSYAAQVKAYDRWAIAAYIRALQLSQHAALSDVPAEEVEKLAAAKEEKH